MCIHFDMEVVNGLQTKLLQDGCAIDQLPGADQLSIGQNAVVR